jgi:hypothetical protein
VTLYLLYLLFQENKSFGAITICIHPLMIRSRVRNTTGCASYFWTIFKCPGGVYILSLIFAFHTEYSLASAEAET